MASFASLWESLKDTTAVFIFFCCALFWDTVEYFLSTDTVEYFLSTDTSLPSRELRRLPLQSSNRLSSSKLRLRSYPRKWMILSCYMLAIGPHSCTSTTLMNMSKRKSNLSISSKPKSKPSRHALCMRKKRMKMKQNKCSNKKQSDDRAKKRKEKEKQEQSTKFGLHNSVDCMNPLEKP